MRQLDGSPIQSLAAGGSHSLFSLAFPGARIEKGAFDERISIPANVLETWACGFGQYGQLGDRAYIHLSAPRLVRELRILTPPEVRAAVLFPSESRCGRGGERRGEAMNGVPLVIICLQRIEGELFDKLYLGTAPQVSLPPTQVACGENHSAVLVWEPVAAPSSSKENVELTREERLKWPTVTYKPVVYVFGHNLGGQCGTGKPGNLAKLTTPQVGGGPVQNFKNEKEQG